MNRVLAGLVSVVIGGALLPATGGPAGAADHRVPGTDHTGPTITMQPTGHLLVKAGTITNFGAPHPDELYETPVVARWGGSDPSGICDYQVWSDSGRDIPQLLADVGTATSYRLLSGDLDEGDGGYNQTNIEIRAMDCAGNWSVSGDKSSFPATDRALHLPDNVNYLYPIDDTTARYAGGSGAWTHSTGASFMFGSDIHAVTAGASATVTYTGKTFGWVSELGPQRGSAEVYQDGVLKATVSLHAEANTGPQVVWSNWFAHATTHTITIVVVGTAGHPRVDVDGFFTGPNF
ncbi:MAG: hypothetical protein ABI083_06890 [Lapillicoccus sp.]